MKTLGIDPGYGLCGFAIVEGNQQDLTLLDYGVIKTTPNTNFNFRIQEIAHDIEQLITTHTPQRIAVEDLFFVQNITTGLQVAEVRGVIRYIAMQHGHIIIEPKPMEVKQSFTGNGHATKADIKRMAALHFGLKDAPVVDDASDAIAIAYYGALLPQEMIDIHADL